MTNHTYGSIRNRIVSAVSTLMLCALIALAAPASRAQLVFHLSMDTSALVGHPAGPFYLDFQLNDGSGANDGNNTATLSNFAFGGGGAGPSGAMLTGGASGDLGSGVSITDSSFLNDFTQEFMPGSTLDFDALLSTDVDLGPTPDQFTFAILDSTFSEIPTINSFADVFMLVDINSSNPAIQVFSSDLTRTPVAGGPAIDIPTPSIGSAASVPEPSTSAYLLVFLPFLYLVWRRQRDS